MKGKIFIPYSKNEFRLKWKNHFFKNSSRKNGVVDAILSFENKEIDFFEFFEKADIYSKKYSKKELRPTEVLNCLTIMKVPKIKKNKVDYIQIKFKNS